MSFEKGDTVRLRDKHSEHDGEVGEVTRVSETMFGDETYTVNFDGGQEAGLPADALEAAGTSETEASDG
jgi:hypothetical protein